MNNLTWKNLAILIFYKTGRIVIFLSKGLIKNRLSLIFYFAILNIKLRYKSTVLGVLWAALEPLLYFSVLYLVFTSIRDREETFAISLLTGILFFHVFVRGTSGGLNSLVGNSGYIKSLNIKRDFFPIVPTVAVGILAFVDIGVFIALMHVFGFSPSWTILLIPLPIILMFVLILGLSYLLSIANVFFRDIQVIWGIFSHSLLFISPIFWRPDNVEGFLLEIHKINPLGQVIEISKKLVIDGKVPLWNEWLYTTSLIVGILIFGYWVFHKLEGRIAEEI